MWQLLKRSKSFPGHTPYPRNDRTNSELLLYGASLVAQTVKRLQCWRPRFAPWVGKIPWRRKWQPTPIFFPGESNGQKSLFIDYSPWDRKSWT